MKNTILLALSVLFFWSCNNSTKTTPPDEVEKHVETTNEHHHNESDEAVELNNGQRWIVNEEMKPFVAQGEELISTYIQEGKTDYKTLAEQLIDQNNQLIKSCTMTGKSHDELHKWLHPHLEIVNTLKQESDTEKANEIIAQIQHSYEQYHEYFQ